MNNWNSKQYRKFEKERTQPSADLISRIELSPKSILDIGCGPGNSTNRLREYFPDADIVGVDNSENMLDNARTSYPDLSFKYAQIPDDLEQLASFDLIFSNACLQWIPNHKQLLPKLMSKLNSGGLLAVQIPLVQEADFYKLLGEFINCDKWQRLKSIRNFHNLSPDETYDVLTSCADEVTMWQTTYYHIVPSHDSVIEWYKGSGLRPYLDMLESEERDEFLSQLSAEIQKAYPVQADNTVILKMPRLFFTAKKQ